MSVSLECPITRTKYIDEMPATAEWFIFGTHPQTGRVDLSDGNDDVFTEVDPDLAVKLIALRTKFVRDMIQMIGEHHENSK